MQLNITEISQPSTTQNPYELPYYEDTVNDVISKRKKVSFNDILTNMNLVVNSQGVLQFMTPSKPDTSSSSYQYDEVELNSNTDFANIQKSNAQQPLDPAVKHSYIFNKYFKDYAVPNVEKPAPRVPKTIQEYKEMLLEDKKRAIEHRIRMAQIKPKTMLYASVNINGTHKNNLRKMSFY